MSSPPLNSNCTQKVQLSRACDACRLRKTRCDLDNFTSDVACARCRRLQLRCTFDLVTEKRGPKRKRRDDVPLSPDDTSVHTSNVSPTGLTTVSHEPSRPYPTDAICPRKLLRVILDDYLASIYPLIPVVHRPSFLINLEEGRDIYDDDFLGLLVALCAVVISLLPSRFDYYRNFVPCSLCAQSRADVVNRCYDLLNSLRGPDYFEKVGFEKWAASYLMLIAFFQVGKPNRARMIEVENMQLGRLLDLHRIERYRGLDCIETQLRKKAFWLLFYGYIHSEVQNFRKEKLSFLDHAAMEAINLEALMPFEVEDEQISKHCISTSTVPQLKLVSGFVIHSRIFWQALQDPYAENKSECLCCRSRSPDAQITHLRSRLKQLKQALNDIPVSFQQWALPSSTSDSSQIMSSQIATLRANIHVTHLWLQSLLLDQLGFLTSPEEHWHDREIICTQLLQVLHNIPQKDIEPNGLHLVYKVRDVAVGLLACPFVAPDLAAKRAHEYVKEFTDIMARLDASESVNTANIQSWIDIGRQNV